MSLADQIMGRVSAELGTEGLEFLEGDEQRMFGIRLDRDGAVTEASLFRSALQNIGMSPDRLAEVFCESVKADRGSVVVKVDRIHTTKGPRELHGADPGP